MDRGGPVDDLGGGRFRCFPLHYSPRSSSRCRTRKFRAFLKPASSSRNARKGNDASPLRAFRDELAGFRKARNRSEEHTSELQSRLHLVCRLLLEKKKT